MTAYSFDLKNFPLVICNAEGDITPAELDAHFAEYRALLDRKQQYALVFDATNVGTVNAYTRQKYAEFMKVNATDLSTCCVGCAFVISSRVIRGALTAVLWIAGSLPFPHTTVATREQAIDDAKRLLSR